MLFIILSNKITYKVNISRHCFHNILCRMVFIFLISLRTHIYLERTYLLLCPTPTALLGSIVVKQRIITKMQDTFFFHKKKNKCNVSVGLTTLKDVSRRQSTNLHEVQKIFMNCQHSTASLTQWMKFSFFCKTSLISRVHDTLCTSILTSGLHKLLIATAQWTSQSFATSPWDPSQRSIYFRGNTTQLFFAKHVSLPVRASSVVTYQQKHLAYFIYETETSRSGKSDNTPSTYSCPVSSVLRNLFLWDFSSILFNSFNIIFW